MESLCDTFRRQASGVWNRMRTAAKLQLFMSEETLTETTLFEIARKHQSGEFIVIPATKSQESVHGADWLFWFVANGKGISYRVQAKRLFPSGRYESLLKSGKDLKGTPIDPEQQLKKLIAKADEAQHIPLYCFYNFQHPDGDFRLRSHSCLHDYRPPSFWGCSVALAQDVQFARSDALKALRPYMMPWHLLACSSDGDGLAEAASRAGRLLADAKGEPSVIDGIIQWERPRRDIPLDLRTIPEYVSELVEIHDRHTRSPVDRRREIDVRARTALEEQELAGVAIFDGTRKSP